MRVYGSLSCMTCRVNVFNFCKRGSPSLLFSSFEYCQPLGAGAFRRALTTNVASQCRAFSRALEIEKLKAPLFWCIIFQTDI